MPLTEAITKPSIPVVFIQALTEWTVKVVVHVKMGHAAITATIAWDALAVVTHGLLYT